MPKPKITIRPIKTSEFVEWRQVLASSEEGSPYQLPEYLQSLAKATGNKTRFIGVFEGDNPKLVGGIGLLCCQSALTRYASSRVLLYYNGPFIARHSGMSDSREERRRIRLLKALGQYLKSTDLDYVRFKARHAAADFRSLLHQGWTATPFYSYLMRTDNPDKLWRDIAGNLKRLIRRGEKQALSFNDTGSFDDFYDMHLETHERKQSPVYLEKAKFRAFVTDLLDARIARLFEVRTADDITIASQLVLLSDHPVAHTIAASSRVEFQRTGCNPFLRWKVCQWLHQNGYQGLDLTDAQVLSVARFKSEMGGKLALAMEFQSPLTSTARIRIATEQNLSRLRAFGDRINPRAQ